MRKTVIGIIAHVDAGKTTLSEAMLYLSGATRKLGRVDHGDAFLDTDAQERQRGITIFSKQARMEYGDLSITLMDTPGHVDFSAEMERTLTTLDCAILVISGTDGIQSHTETLWHLLTRFNIPTFIFVNKMDLAGADREKLVSSLNAAFGDGAVDIASPDAFEEMSMCDETLMEKYLDSGTLSDADIAEAVAKRRIFPCFFGSALKLEGVREFLDGLEKYAVTPSYPKDFGARVYKIGRDQNDVRLTYMKLTGGSITVKDTIDIGGERAKIDQIRLYSGAKFEPVQTASAGDVCAVTGLDGTFAGQHLGFESGTEMPVLQPVLTYQIILPKEQNVPEALKKLRILEEEDPQLMIVWDEQHREIHLRLMGDVQQQVLQNEALSRFGLKISFGQESILYKETIAAPVEGVGHFEPLRHYAEVHLLLTPTERGSGLTFDSRCSTDVLDLNWQRLIMTHLEEKTHLGVLTGSPITDMRISIITGRSHPKHTEGGDFRQATYRAIRHGLRNARSVLLEPYYDMVLRLPPDSVGRAMTDIQKMGGTLNPPEQEGEMSVLRGYAPVRKVRGYSAEVSAYTKGRGSVSFTVRGYDECPDSEEIIAEIGYDADADVENTADSVFCAHGAGFVVPWYKVHEYMHLEAMKFETGDEHEREPELVYRGPAPSYRGTAEEDKELQKIFENTYGASKKKEFIPRKQDVTSSEITQRPSKMPDGPEYVLVDGYNIIFAWDDLKKLAEENLEAARQSLADIMVNYQGYRKNNVIVVFDAYRVHGNPGSVEKYNSIHIVYTKEAETADSYIEKATYEMSRKYRVRVATSDNMEQLIILGHGASRVSADAFRSEVASTNTEIASILKRYRDMAGKRSTVGEMVDIKKK